MPIDLARPPFAPVARRAIVWINSPVPNEARDAFEMRGYAVTTYGAQQLGDKTNLNGCCATVFAQTEKLSGLLFDLRTYAPRVLDHDCVVIVVVDERSETPVRQALQNLGLAESVTDALGPSTWLISRNTEWNGIANAVTEARQGPAPNLTLEIRTDPDVVLSEEDTLLLQRAFADCSCLTIRRHDDGRSKSSVFCAHAELTTTHWPQPFFIKLGTRQGTIREYTAYENFVSPFIPFHLGPRLTRDRCCLSSTRGVLVGDYVDGAEQLAEGAPHGRSTSAIACLFDKTLLGFHRHTEMVDRSIADGLAHLFPKEGAIKRPRITRAMELGASRELPELRRLFEQSVSRPVLVGSIHGDLHAENILVRAHDAIVIDFAAYEQMLPLLWDAAWLEVSLLVDAFPDGADLEAWSATGAHEWIELISPLYEMPLGNCGTPMVTPAHPAFWFYACVQQIRKSAREWECGEGQYAATLALALLRKSSKDPHATEQDSSRKAAAYVLAERVLVSTFGED